MNHKDQSDTAEKDGGISKALAEMIEEYQRNKYFDERVLPLQPSSVQSNIAVAWATVTNGTGENLHAD